jgi:hypothetical protein
VEVVQMSVDQIELSVLDETPDVLIRRLRWSQKIKSHFTKENAIAAVK